MTVNGKVRQFLFVKEQKSLSCNNVTSEPLRASSGDGTAFCTVSCIKAAAENCTCAGWMKENNKSCNFCYECKGGSSTSPLNATYVPYNPTSGMYYLS